MVVDQGKEKKRSILMKTECSLQQLAFEVENVYKAFRCQYPFGDKEVNEIKMAILTRSYVLLPLRLVVLPIEFPKSKFLQIFTIPVMLVTVILSSSYQPLPLPGREGDVECCVLEK